MSKEYVRQYASRRFGEFGGLNESQKAYPNYEEDAIPTAGCWARLEIDFVTAEVAGVGDEPYTGRTGVISVKVRERRNVGTKVITMLTDALEEHFQLKNDGSLFTDAANTINSEKNDTYYEAIVYIPFTFDPKRSIP